MRSHAPTRFLGRIPRRWLGQERRAEGGHDQTQNSATPNPRSAGAHDQALPSLHNQRRWMQGHGLPPIVLLGLR